MENYQEQIKKPRIFEEKEQIKENIGSIRKFQQIYDIGYFEIIRNFKKTLILMGVAASIFILSLIIELYRLSKGLELPDDPAEFALKFLGMMNLLILICATSYGGSIIVVDFEKLTGNILFPKISRERLLIGRFTANFLMNASIMIFYYILVAVIVFIKYLGVPKILWVSLGWTLLYSLLILSFVSFFSSFMKSTAGAVVTTLFLNLIIFSIIESIFSLISTKEPLFLIHYYARIITGCFDMPGADERSQTIPIMEGMDMTLWITPDPARALIGTAIFVSIFLFSTYLIFRNRQNK